MSEVDKAFDVQLPETPAQLRWLLATRICVGAILIGILGGLATYALISYRTEMAAMQRVVAGVQHFKSSAVRIASVMAQEDHSEIDRLFDQIGFLGVRVFDRDRRVLLERWGKAPTPIISGVNGQIHVWPSLGGSHSSRFLIQDIEIIRVILPLAEEGRLVGYVEGISKVAAEEISRQRQQIVDSSVMTGVSVIVAAALLYPMMLAMLYRAGHLSRRLLDSNLSLMRSLGNAIAKRDSETDAHNYRVTCYAVRLAEACGLSASLIADLIVGAFLHDVGKIGIPDHILLKRDLLTTEEFHIMQSHVLVGVEIVDDNPWLKAAVLTIRHHHERFDGNGYPDGLAGDEIPLTARIFTLVDVFDALTSTRPYKPALSLEETIAIMDRGSGFHFDPEFYATFKSLAPELYMHRRTWDRTAWSDELRRILCRYFRLGNVSATERCGGRNR